MIRQDNMLPIAEFAYNNAKNAKTSPTSFKLNCGYYPRVLFEEDVDFYSRSHSVDKQAEKLRELIKVCCQNLPHNKGVKSCNFCLGKKI